MGLRFGYYTIGIGAMVLALTVASAFRALGSQTDQTSAPISASGELLRLRSGSLSLPPANGPGATATGTVTARLTTVPPPGRPGLAHALAYFSFTSDAPMDITGGFILTLKLANSSRCTGVRTGLAFLGGSGWNNWETHFAAAELGCDSAGDFVATLYPRGTLRIAPGSPIVLAVFRGRPLSP
jgi:hypothetical protein